MSAVHSQWTLIAPNRVLPLASPTAEWGAIDYKDGILWVGWQDLWFSPDSGKTWQKSNIPLANSAITNIDFFDNSSGIVSTNSQGVFLTRDRGQTWSQILSTSTVVPSSVFDSAPNVIHALLASSDFYTTTNGGLSWTSSHLPDDLGVSFTITKDRTIYVHTSPFFGNGSIWASNDLGSNWHVISQGYIDADSYSLCADSCDANRLYLANEEYFTRNNGNSEIFISSDRGQSWISAIGFQRTYFTGSMTCTKNAIFTSSLTNGLYRSIDRGLTWKSIGGPSGILADSRNIACIDDNILFVLDGQGNIWETINSGGDSLQIHTSTLQINSDNITRRIASNSRDQFPVSIYYPHEAYYRPVDSISFILKYSESIEYLGDSVCQGWSIRQSAITDSTILFALRRTIPAAPALDSMILKVYFQGVVSNEKTATLTLDEINFNQDTTFRDCMIAALSKTDTLFVDITNECGDSILRQFLTKSTIPFRILSLRPNPAQDELQIDVQSAVKQDANIEICNALGVRVYSDSRNLANGANSIHLETKGLASGLYIVRITSACGATSQEFVKVN
ncbi:MAG: T9SS type A sorting domain-containing protein [Bacteroidota bacterium]|nr:T9SS type A sorting domain-containing protein [Bacteroidota bacterium]